MQESARTYLLTGGAFAVGTSAYVVSGILPSVSTELSVSTAAAGQLVTAFALAYALAAPMLAVVTGRWDRRAVLVFALGTAAAGNAVSAVATSYPLLLGGRVIAAFGAALFTPAATLFATTLLPPHERGRAVARVFGGLTFALVLGVPVGALLADPLGYRGVFAVVAAVCAVLALTARLGLPALDPPPPAGLRERFAVAADRRAQLVLGMTVLGVLSAMVVFTYAAPLLDRTAGATGGALSLLLLAYGLGAMVGNSVGGRAADRFGALRTLGVVMAGFLTLLASLPWTLSSVPLAAVTLIVWGGFTWSFNPPMQHLLLELSPASAGGLLLGLNASAIYLGAGLSGIVGGIVIRAADVLAVPVVATGLGLIAFALLIVLRRELAAGPARGAVVVSNQSS